MTYESLDTWEGLKAECEGCFNCELCKGRHNVVFGTGSTEAEIMFIGEGPGEQEDLQGIPFVGPAGKLLDSMLEMIDLDRSKVYIANIVKCRPPGNRDPKETEQVACISWLYRQMVLLNPKIVVCLGRIAAGMIMNKNLKITKEHGLWYIIEGRHMMATYHPSALLRDPSKRPEAFCDLRKLRKEIQAVCSHTY